MVNDGSMVSVIIIAYNNADTVQECLQSILYQNYMNKDVNVIYDEGSTDKTHSILQSLAKRYEKRFNIISTQHVGRSKARNIGLKCSKGDVLFFVDADDVYNSDYLDKAISILDSDPKMGGVCLTGASLVDKKGMMSGYYEVYSGIQQNKVKSGLFIPSWAWVYKREAVEKVGGYDEMLDQAEDKDLFLRVTSAGYSIGLVPGVNWLHRRPSSLASHLRKSYIGAKSRILFIKKHGRWRELHTLLPFWLLVSFILYSPFETIMFIPVIFSVILYICVSMVQTSRFVWNDIKAKYEIPIYSILNLLTYSSSALGLSHGLLNLLFRRPKADD